MCALSSPAVRPFAGGIPRRAATAPSDASERACVKKRPRVAPARDASACLTKMTRNRNGVVTAAGEMSSQELLQKRLASELDALRGLLKKAELIAHGGGACKGGAPTAGKKERFLASNQRPTPIEKDFNAPSLKRRKISTLMEQKQQQIPAPRMSPEERNQLACRLSSLSGELPGHIVEFLQKQFGDADTHGEIEFDIDSVKDSVLFELKTLLDKLAEESKDGKLAEERKGEVVLEQEEGEYIDICGLSSIVETGSKPSSSTSSDSLVAVDCPAQVPPEQIVATPAQPPSEPARAVQQQSTEAKKVPDAQRAAPPKPVSLAGLLYRAKVRRELLEMERAALPDERIHPRDLHRLGIAEYGHPSLMRQLGLVLKVGA
ncbi:hypothetical protein BDA96_04G221500 [Sorghum bicolor]|uniref:NET domain-containing protein n=2 Tax=Sorghum bicolor TaxID=4558 RepID=A0A921UJV7_SORBI|nr:hypothetical protein BDA96_04G221500 [Sorghum bicolor]OQU85265.1 hypothetical protein SORBI_3004G207766 [Sorghum bicolor]